MTVAELIAALSTYPPDAMVVLDDPDTGWWLTVHPLREEHGVVLITSDYTADSIMDKR